MPLSRRILFLCAETSPPIYASLELMWNDILPRRGFEAHWVMWRPGEGGVESLPWGRGRVQLVPKRPADGLALAAAGWGEEI